MAFQEIPEIYLVADAVEIPAISVNANSILSLNFSK